MKNAKRSKQGGYSPKGSGRNERAGRVSQKQARTFEHCRTKSDWHDTGVFTGVSNPVVGVSDTVARSTRAMAKAALRAERQWAKSLSAEDRALLRSVAR
jgi:hypothetical protein